MDTDEQFQCRMCGDCCYFEIPLTLVDIERFGKVLSISNEEAFKRYAQPTISKGSGLLKLTKKKDRSCPFLEDRKCTIHDNKPQVCTFFNCQQKALDNCMPVSFSGSSGNEKRTFWRHVVALEVTKAYVQKLGPVWDEEHFKRALESIAAAIREGEHGRILFARNTASLPISLTFDCNECKNPGKIAKETPITLVDIDRISEELKIGRQAVFRRYIANEPATLAGGMKLKRENGLCAFFKEDVHCTLGENKPTHCRFTPCPLKVGNSTQFDCFLLGSGTLEEQFQHQVAMALTREYIENWGIRLTKKGFTQYYKELEMILANEEEFKVFCEKISPYRFFGSAEVKACLQSNKRNG